MAASLLRLREPDQPQFEAWLDTLPAGAGVVVLLAERDVDWAAQIQAACRHRGIQLAGALFPGVLDEDGFYQQGLNALAWPQSPPLISVPGVRDHLDATVNTIHDFVGTHSGEERPLLFLFVDSQLPCIASLVDSLYLDLADRVSYAGVNAGSETFQPINCLFDQNQMFGDGLIALLLPSGCADLEHGYKDPEQFVTASSTVGNRILEIEWQPAFEFYQRKVAEQFGVEINHENFYQLGVHFPLGIQRATGMPLVRIPVALNEDGSIFCVGEVPRNAILTLLKPPVPGDSATVDALVGKYHAKAGDPLLFFYCAGRRLHLGVDAAQAEIRQLAQQLNGAPLIGALGLGEIGSISADGYPLFHNATLVLINAGCK